MSTLNHSHLPFLLLVRFCVLAPINLNNIVRRNIINRFTAENTPPDRPQNWYHFNSENIEEYVPWACKISLIYDLEYGAATDQLFCLKEYTLYMHWPNTNIPSLSSSANAYEYHHEPYNVRWCILNLVDRFILFLLRGQDRPSPNHYAFGETGTVFVSKTQYPSKKTTKQKKKKNTIHYHILFFSFTCT